MLRCDGEGGCELDILACQTTAGEINRCSVGGFHVVGLYTVTSGALAASAQQQARAAAGSVLPNHTVSHTTHHAAPTAQPCVVLTLKHNEQLSTASIELLGSGEGTTESMQIGPGTAVPRSLNDCQVRVFCA